MFSQDDDNQGVVLGVLFGLIALVIALVIGVAIYKVNDGAGSMAAGSASGAVTASAVSAPAMADEASVKVVGGVVKFYFATGKSDLAAGGKEAVAEVVRAVATGKKAIISGFHDATGDPAKNAELAKQRAFMVRDQLKELGVAEDMIELKKPEETTGSGSDGEARRVEVRVL